MKLLGYIREVGGGTVTVVVERGLESYPEEGTAVYVDDEYPPPSWPLENQR